MGTLSGGGGGAECLGRVVRGPCGQVVSRVCRMGSGGECPPKGKPDRPLGVSRVSDLAKGKAPLPRGQGGLCCQIRF
jgi:hypothetical protein